MMIVSSMVVLQISGISFFLYLEVIFCAYMITKRKKVVFLKYPLVNLIYIGLFISAISAVIHEMPDSYKKTAVVLSIYALPTYFTLSFLCNEIKWNISIISVIIKGLKISALLNLFWVPLQYIAFHFFGIDINDILFTQIFHFVENASFIRSWQYFPSGFSWHSAVMAPLLVYAMVLFKNPYIRILIIVDAAICGNSTALVGVCCCMVIMAFFYFKNKKNYKKYLTTKTLIICTSLLLLLIVALFNGLLNIVFERFEYMYARLFSGSKDESTEAHLRYYTDYFKIVKDSSIFQILFGYGYGCSGYPISAMYGLYESKSNWAIESDFVNIIVSQGIMGFIAMYTLILHNIIKGYKISYKYIAVMVPVMIQGLGYNVQWEYVLFMEILMYIAIKHNINIFDLSEKPEQELVRRLTNGCINLR